jgi:hypothetical protein
VQRDKSDFKPNKKAAPDSERLFETGEQDYFWL